MQLAITFFAVVAGLILSLAVAVATEELIFGRFMRLMFFQQNVRQTGQAANRAERKTAGIVPRK